VLPLLSQVVVLSLDSLAVGVLAARLMPSFAALPYALAFGLSDAFAAMLGRGIGLGYGMVILLALSIGVIAIHCRLNPAAGWRTAAGAALPLVFGLDSLACPVTAADLPALALASTSLALLGLMMGRAAGRSMPAFGQAAVLALAGLMLFV
jgi:hypothetical protein